MDQATKRVVVGTTLHEESDFVVRTGAAIARALGATVELVNAFEEPLIDTGGPFEPLAFVQLPTSDVRRRSFLAWITGAGAVAALAAGYGTLAAYLARFLYPAGPPHRGWIFVRELARFHPGESLGYVTPSGATVNVARLAARDEASSFIALSSTCPHLGCQVRWEAQGNRFVCPCHGGVFLPDGTAVAGPPGKAGQRLLRYELRVDRGLLFIAVPFGEAGAHLAAGAPTAATVAGAAVAPPTAPGCPKRAGCPGCGHARA